MTFRRLALFVAVASASAREDCSGANCAVKSQQLLQKAKSQKGLKVSKVANGELDNYRVLESFVDLLALQQSPLTDEQMAIVRDLNTTFYEQTLPTLFERQQNDERLLDQHAEAVLKLNMEFQENKAQIEIKLEESMAADAMWADCEMTASSLRLAHEQAVAVMNDFLQTSTPSCGSIPEQRQPTPEMDQWVMCNLGFYRGFNSSYYSYKAASDAAEATWSLMSANCSALENTAGGKYCDWAGAVWGVGYWYPDSYAEAKMLFEETLSTSEDNSDGRKTDYSALVKIECYLRVLLGQDMSAAGSIHTTCDNAAVNTQQFDIVAPELAPIEDMSSLGQPDAGKC